VEDAVSSPSIAAFFDELQKIGAGPLMAKVAGVGWDVHGYSVPDPEAAVAPLEAAGDAYDKKMEADLVGAPQWPGKKPEIKRRFRLLPWGQAKQTKKSLQAQQDWQQAADAYRGARRKYYEDNPPPDDSFFAMRDLRVRTPHDKGTNYKLNDWIAANAANELWESTTDTSYGDTPTIRNLSREDMQRVLAIYQRASQDPKALGGIEDRESYDRQVQAFVNKAKALMANPEVKTMRLEYE